MWPSSRRNNTLVCGVRMRSRVFELQEPFKSPFGGACTDFFHCPGCGYLCGSVEYSCEYSAGYHCCHPPSAEAAARPAGPGRRRRAATLPSVCSAICPQPIHDPIVDQPELKVTPRLSISAGSQSPLWTADIRAVTWDRRASGRPPRSVHDDPHGPLHSHALRSDRYLWYLIRTSSIQASRSPDKPFPISVAPDTLPPPSRLPSPPSILSSPPSTLLLTVLPHCPIFPSHRPIFLPHLPVFPLHRPPPPASAADPVPSDRSIRPPRGRQTTETRRDGAAVPCIEISRRRPPR